MSWKSSKYILGSKDARLWIWQGSEYARVTGFQIYHNMAEYVLIGYEYDWITEYAWI